MIKNSDLSWHTGLSVTITARRGEGFEGEDTPVQRYIKPICILNYFHLMLLSGE